MNYNDLADLEEPFQIARDHRHRSDEMGDLAIVGNGNHLGEPVHNWLCQIHQCGFEGIPKYIDAKVMPPSLAVFFSLSTWDPHPHMAPIPLSNQWNLRPHMKNSNTEPVFWDVVYPLVN